MSLFPVIARPVDVTDAEQFPEIALAMEHLRQMNAERRAELEREWNDPDFVFDAFGEPPNVR